MTRLEHQLSNAAEIIRNYSGNEPFHIYLNRHFKRNKQFGSRDRRFYKNACYAFWRYGCNFKNTAVSDIIKAMLQAGSISPEETEHIFPLTDTGESAVYVPVSNLTHMISSKILTGDYQKWFQQEPPVYLVAAPGKSGLLLKELRNQNIEFHEEGDVISTFPRNKLDRLVENGLCRIQDKGSRQVITDLDLPDNSWVWDCCSGAGGKSLTIAEINKVQLYCSDIRPAVLENLKNRFLKSGISMPRTATINLAETTSTLDFDELRITEPYFDIIVADVPCSGSGTWRRNPEQLHLFNEKSLEKFVELQRNIVQNAGRFLKPGGTLIYITCSVFEKENELNAAAISQLCSLKVEQTAYVGGKEMNADYFFRAILRK